MSMSKSTSRQRKRNNQVLQTRESKLQEQKEKLI